MVPVSLLAAQQACLRIMRGLHCSACSSMRLYALSVMLCREIAEVAGIDEKDILYLSPSNEALAHLPYMIALDR